MWGWEELGGFRGRQGVPGGCDAGLTPTKGEGEGRGIQCLMKKFQPGQSQGMLATKLPVGQIWHWNRIV